MAFERKADALFSLKPDIAVVPECSQAASSSFQAKGYKGVWFGFNTKKGLAVFCRQRWSMQLIHEPDHKFILPIQVDGPERFTLLAVWACAVGSSHKESYVGQIYRSIAKHPEWFSGVPVIIAGDFNSNAVWDKSRAVGNHSTVVKMLAQHGLVSAYHTHYEEQHGCESIPTQYLYRHPFRQYHIDYIFIPEDWRVRLKGVQIGTYAGWKHLSDHCPISIDLQPYMAP